MAATATISASTTLPVGRSTMSLVGTITSPSNASGSAGAASPAAVSHTLTSSAGQTLGGGTSGTALASAVKAAAAAIAVSKTPAPAAVVPSKAPVVASPADDTYAGHQASPAASIPVNTSPAAPVTAITAAPTSATAPAATTTAAPGSGEATTFFDDMINAPQPPANILTLSPTTSLPDLYHDFFDNHPELYDSDQSSDPEMEDLVDLEDYSSAAAIRARTMADMRQTAVSSIQLPLIADRPKLETIDTINLMLHHQTGAHGNGRQGLAHNHGQHSSDDNCASSQAPQRRKKASRACFHCQKAHLTCDDTRPCQRCVKRDLAGSCTDGVRKKAKYLQDAIDSQQRAAEQVRLDQESQQAQTCANGAPSLDDAQALFSFTNVPSPVAPAPSSLSSLTAKAIAPLSPIPTSPSTETTVVPDYGFGSEAINLEYSILSTMLSSPTTELQSMTSELSMVENWQRQGTLEAMANTLQQQRRLQQLSPQQLQNSTINNNNNNNNSSSSSNINTSGISANGIFGKNSGSNLQTNGSSRVSKRKFPSNTPENVYANTKQPFNYTDGFHYLLRYVRERMDKEEMMRVCRAMAMFRPSFIALIMNLTPEDLIFMETCFQRTVLEFEKLISFSGTPTVVWRRTGEIALVGKEFSLLTQWSRDQLLNKKTYIYELMDNQSAVEYWEKFSTHAFENTEQTVMTTCILLSPTNRVVPCTFCFTIKRDIFDIPLAIVGNFLPILS